MEFLLCTGKHFSQPKTLSREFLSTLKNLSTSLLRKLTAKRSTWCLRQAGTLLQAGKSRSLVREPAECSPAWSSRQAASQGAAVTDVRSVCFVPHPVMLLREVLWSSGWHISGAASLTSNRSCTAQLSPGHRETLTPLSGCGLGLANDLFRNNSSALHSFYLCRCFSSLIYCAKEVMVRVAPWQMAPTSARKAGLGPPSSAQGHSQSVQGADMEHKEATPAINRHPVATSSRNPPVQTPLPLGDENGHNFHIALILPQNKTLRSALGQHSCVLPPTTAKWGKV